MLQYSTKNYLQEYLLQTSLLSNSDEVNSILPQNSVMKWSENYVNVIQITSNVKDNDSIRLNILLAIGNSVTFLIDTASDCSM